MILEKAGLWLMWKILESMAKRARDKGKAHRTYIVDKGIKHAKHAVTTKTTADDDVLYYLADLTKSERIHEALKVI